MTTPPQPENPEPFRYTTGRWFNKLKGSGKYAKAPAYRQGFHYEDFAYGNDYPEDFTPGAPLQISIICAPSAKALAIDVDYPEALPDSETGKLINSGHALSRRGSHFHVLVDMRGVDAAGWPQQGRTAWGDIKAAGFIPFPGSQHYSGEPYAPAGNGPVAATGELIAALKADRLAYAQQRLADASGPGNPRVTGVRLEDGTYVFSSGYVAGSWAQLPDGFLRHDDELKDLAWDMGIRGLDETVVLSEWYRLAGASDPSDPWTESDFRRHWRNIPAAVEQARAEQEQEARFFGVADPADQAAIMNRHREPDNWQPYAGEDDPVPDMGAEQAPDFAEQARGWLGPWEFDPRGTLDSEHAEDTLARNYPMSRYSPSEDVWLSRRLDRWKVVPADQADGLVENLVPYMDPNRRGRSLKDLVAEGADPANLTDDQRDRIRLHENRKRFGNAGSAAGIARKIRAKLKSPMPHPYWCDPADLDRDAYELWAGGVAWDLRASVNDLVRRTVPSNFVHLHSAGYFPKYHDKTEAVAPLFTTLIRAVWPDEAEREWALNVLAVGFTGSPKKVLPVLQGGRDSGKTTTVQLLLDVLGSYGSTVNRKLLNGDTSTHDTIIMDLMGLRLAYLDEGVRTNQTAKDRLKNIAGGSDLTGHRMRKDSVSFRATHTLVMSVNPGEDPPLDDEAVRSRIRWIPCHGDPAQVIAAARCFDYFNSPEWKKEAPYVLGHMIVRCARVLADESVIDKHSAPFAVQEAEQAVAEAQDDILQWFKEETVPEPGGYPARALYKSFRAWFRDLNDPRIPVPTETKWGRRMNALIPEDDPNSRTRLMSSSNTVLRRARPRPENFFGFQPSDPPGNNPAPLSRENTIFTDSSDSTDTHNTPIYTHTHTHINSGDAASGFKPPDSPEPSGGNEKAKSEPPRSSPSVAETQDPPKPKKPKTEAQLAREADRKTARAAEREQARLAKITELGGPLVQLPAIVTRDLDLKIIGVHADTARHFLRPYLGALSVDVEHSGYPVGHDDYELRLVQLGGESAAVVLDPSDPAQREVISGALGQAAVLHAHSALADLVPLEHAGLCDRAAWGKMTDTVILAKLTDPKLTDSDEAALKPLAKALLGEDYAQSWRCDKARAELFAAGGWLTETELLTPRERSGWANVPLCETFVRYAASDVMDCAAVARVLR